MFVKYVIDRIEGGFAVCQNLLDSEKMTTISLQKLPPEVKEGNYLIYEDGVYSIDTEGEAEARARIQLKMNKLFDRK